MAKLDEIAELLTEEIHSFERSIERLERLQHALNYYELKPDTTEVNFLLKGHNDRQKLIIEQQNSLLQDLSNHIQKARLYPDWVVKLFWVWGFLNLVAWCTTLFFLMNG